MRDGNGGACDGAVLHRLGPAALGVLIYFRLLKTLGPLATASGSCLRAGFSVALGIGLPGEPLTASLALGFILILAGVAIMNRVPPRARP